MKFKNILLYLLLMAVIGAGIGCKKFVDVTYPDTLTDPGFWKTENSVRSYSWEFYNMFNGFGNGTSTSGDFYFSSFSDDQAPGTFTQYAQTTASTNGNWFFGYVRKANILLERVDDVAMPDEAKNHWKGVAHFFRAMQYFQLIQTFGGVPWLSRSLDISDSTQIYKPRDSRQLVMDSVLADINFAIANLRQTDLTNTVNKDVALALKARICLFEGTYRKYHTELSLADADKFLLAAKDAAATLMAKSYSLNSNYLAAYNSDNLATDANEVLLYKRYESGTLMHSTIAYLYSSTVLAGLTKSAVESYLCLDGKPITVSPLYQGDNGITNVVANRDKRLLYTIDSTNLYYKGH
ncbi:MAG: RagB/SusD protein, partial [Chitinophagaceae bacterium]|nr:RagB/SusD protein [Chitinophagaceae bacterium]